MSDLDVAIRAKLASWGDDPCGYATCVVIGWNEMRAALLTLVDEHERYHRELGAPQEDHTNEGLPLCQGWPYRPGAYKICRFVRDIAEKLGVEVPGA